MFRLLADEHFPVQVLNRLRSKGHDITTVRQLCQNKAGDGISDEDVLILAINDSRALLTKNCKDFAPLSLLCPRHCGIVACSFDTKLTTADEKRIAKVIDARIRELRNLQSQWVRLSAIEFQTPASKRPKPQRTKP